MRIEDKESYADDVALYLGGVIQARGWTFLLEVLKHVAQSYEHDNWRRHNFRWKMGLLVKQYDRLVRFCEKEEIR